MTSGADGGLVIFDCDGVLVDSERIACRVFADLATSIGVETTFEGCVARYMGRSIPACIDLLETRLGYPVPTDFEQRYYAKIYAAFDRDLRAVPGVEAAIEALHATGVATCVASSGPPERMRRTLGLTGLYERFEGRIFSATDVARGKPFPDLFLHAAERLGADPKRCVVVEDSVAGAAAGRAAGMTVLGYADLVAASTLGAAGATPFRSMAELPELISDALDGRRN